MPGGVGSRKYVGLHCSKIAIPATDIVSYEDALFSSAQLCYHSNVDVEGKRKFPAGMKTAILYPYLMLNNRQICCVTFHARQAAIFSAIYTMNMSILIILIYSWKVNENSRNYLELSEVYYGVQIAYVAIITVHIFNVCFAGLLFYAILKEKYSLISLWVLSTITFTAMEAVCMVYSNVLRDHVNKKFDEWSKEEASFFTGRAFLNVLPIMGVLKFYNMLRAGVTWRGPESIEL